MTAAKKRKAIRADYRGSSVPVRERPWSALTKHQRDLRLDTLGAWHLREVFTDDLCKHQSKAVRTRALRSNEADMHLLVKAVKTGIDLVGVRLERLRAEKDWNAFRQPTEAEVIAAPEVGGNFPDLVKMVDSIVEKALGKEANQRYSFTPRRGRGRPPKTSPEMASAATELRQDTFEAPGRHSSPRSSENASTGFSGGSTSESPSGSSTTADAERRRDQQERQEKRQKQQTSEELRRARLADFQAIREKLTTKTGQLRLDVEACAVYALKPSYYAVATNLDLEWWQERILDSFSLRLGCLAARQSGKSIVTARKTVAFAMTNPATTQLIVALPSMTIQVAFIRKRLAA